MPERSPRQSAEQSSREEPCRACDGPVLSAAEGGATCRCEGCLVAVYCGQDCRESDSSKHKPDCPTMAVSGLQAKFESLGAGPGVDVDSWLARTTKVAVTTGQLPAGLTLQQVDELMAHARAAMPHLPDVCDQLNCLGVVSLWAICGDTVERRLEEKQVFVSAVRAVLACVPPESLLWGMPYTLGVCLYNGDILFQLDRGAEAVEFGRQVVSCMEGSLHVGLEGAPSREAATTVVDGRRERALVFMKAFADWLFNSVIELDSSSDTRAEVLKELEAGVRHAIDLAGPDVSKSRPVIGELYRQLAFALLHQAAYDQALRAARRGMQLPGCSSFYGRLAFVAVKCLLELRRDAEAKSLCQKVLLKTRRCPQLLPDLEHAILLLYHGIALCRSGEYGRSCGTLHKACDLLDSYERGRSDGKDTDLSAIGKWEALLQMLEAMEQDGRVDEVEAMEDDQWSKTKTGAMMMMVRPSCVMRHASRAMASGETDKAMELLRKYADDYSQRALPWAFRGRWPEGHAVQPLEMLRGLLEEGSEEKAQLEALIANSAREDEALRQQALQELQAEMRRQQEERACRRRAKQAGKAKGKGSSKASRKKRKKRERKKQQQRQSGEQGGGEEETAVEGVDLAGLSLQDQGGQSESGETAVEEEEKGEEEAEEEVECPMCLGPLGGAEDGEEDEEAWGHGETTEEEVLGCGHRYHDVCIDRWLCKCREKGLLPTCPMCRAAVVRATG